MNAPEQDPANGSTEFATRARNLLLESADDLDGRTRSRLTQARHAALAQLESAAPVRKGVSRWLLPAGSVAAAVLVAGIWFGTLQPDTAPVQVASSPMDDLELVAGAENFELIEELDFYAWLESEAALSSTGETG